MPKVITYTLAWSSELQRYALFNENTRLDILPESAAWFDWLQQISSFGFITEQGRYTLRKEKKQRGDAYWYAYHSEGGRLLKKYVGKTDDLTPAHLQLSIARREPASSPSSSAQLVNSRPESREVEQEESRSEQAPQEARPALTYLLAPKVHIPHVPAQLVSRPRLLELLERRAQGPLTLVSAQAGSGKTTLLAEWVARHRASVAWVSLELDDNQPTRFLSYVIAALQQLDPLIGSSSLPALKSAQPPAWETLLTLLANEIVASALQPITLVLDDYHLITTETLHQAVIFLLDHLASHLHLILLTRSDPPLPLSRLRGRGQVLELRINDLRFDAEEAEQFLQVATDCQLAPVDVNLLQERTEGWIAGLQLAALSLRGKHDASAFVREFAGSNRFVLDYLSDEILAQLPATTLNFLLHTCVLGRLEAEICAAVLGEEVGISARACQETLEALARANLFVSALDDERYTYRYHSLFARVLQVHLSKSNPTLLPLLHQRACTWFDEHDFLHEAMHHALALQDAARITTLLRERIWDMFSQGEFDVLLGWLTRLPVALEKTQPELCFYHATALAFLGQSDLAEAYLQRVEQAQAADAGSLQGTVSRGELAAVSMIIAVARGELAQAQKSGQHALSELPRAQVFLRSAVKGSEAIMAAISGDFRLATQYLWEAGQIKQLNDNDPFVLQKGMLGMALFMTHLGQLSQVITICEQSMRLVDTVKGFNLPYTGSMAVFFSIALYENNQLEAARERAQQAIEWCEKLGERAFLPVAYALLAQILYLEQIKARGSSAPSPEVLQIMQQAESLLWQQPPALFWSRQHAAYLLVRLWIVQRNSGALARLEQFYPVDAEVGASPGASYAAQTETWGLAYIRLGQHRPEETARWLNWPIQAAEQAGRSLALMRMLILQALAYQELGRIAEALENIKRALRQAEPEGYINIFVEMGQPMLPLLLPLLKQAELSPEIALPFVQTVLRELGVQVEAEQPSSQQEANATASPQVFLTEREKEVLRLLSQGLSNQAIARQMVVEVSTIKWHIHHIYEKLHINSRAQAILQAQARDLL
ncbi:MAG TPA: LuxR C-terminal-related transcriptional regulator [Ktedonobacteraceae bacterium]